MAVGVGREDWIGFERFKRDNLQDDKPVSSQQNQAREPRQLRKSIIRIHLRYIFSRVEITRALPLERTS